MNKAWFKLRESVYSFYLIFKEKKYFVHSPNCNEIW